MSKVLNVIAVSLMAGFFAAILIGGVYMLFNFPIARFIALVLIGTWVLCWAANRVDSL
jgi:hypothetical protein